MIKLGNLSPTAAPADVTAQYAGKGELLDGLDSDGSRWLAARQIERVFTGPMNARVEVVEKRIEVIIPLVILEKSQGRIDAEAQIETAKQVADEEKAVVVADLRKDIQTLEAGTATPEVQQRRLAELLKKLLPSEE